MAAPAPPEGSIVEPPMRTSVGPPRGSTMGPPRRTTVRASLAMNEEENEKERKAATTSPFEVLKGAFTSKASFVFFVCNPKNQTFVGLGFVAALSTLYTMLHAGWRELISQDGFDHRTEFTTVILIGLWGGTFASLFQVSLQDSIDRFRALNGRLDEEIDALSKEVDGLTETSEKLAEELTAFDAIRQEMEECAKSSGVEFKEFFKQTTDIFGSMQDVQKQQDFALLEKAASDIEFMDNEEGMTIREFKMFCSTVPAKFREKLKHNVEETFQSVAGDDNLISISELRQFFDKILDECNPQDGEP